MTYPYNVIDSSATLENPKREHEIMFEGKIQKVQFEHGKPTNMPEALAMKFMKPGFKVVGLDGKPMMAPAVTDDTIQSRIGADEVVAKYDELTIPALKMRAALLPDGEKFVAADVGKQHLIEFIKSGGVKKLSRSLIAHDEHEMHEEIKVEDDPFINLASAGFAWTPVEGSSQVNAFAYDGPSQTLFVEFKGKDGKPESVYEYKGVDPILASDFANAESKGAFLARSIKPVIEGVKITAKPEVPSQPPLGDETASLVGLLGSKQIDPETSIPTTETPDEV